MGFWVFLATSNPSLIIRTCFLPCYYEGCGFVWGVLDNSWVELRNTLWILFPLFLSRCHERDVQLPSAVLGRFWDGYVSFNISYLVDVCFFIRRCMRSLND
jgi:hypothetical protein